MARSAAGHLRVCPHCEELVYRRAVRCPHCESNLRLDNDVRTRFTTMPKPGRLPQTSWSDVAGLVLLTGVVVIACFVLAPYAEPHVVRWLTPITSSAPVRAMLGKRPLPTKAPSKAASPKAAGKASPPRRSGT